MVGIIQSVKNWQYVTNERLEGSSYVDFKITDLMYVSCCRSNLIIFLKNFFKFFMLFRKCSFRIFPILLSKKVQVRLWDDFAKEFHKSLSEANVFPAVIILSSAKANRNNYTGISTLTNVSATAFYINGNCESIDKLRRM